MAARTDNSDDALSANVHVRNEWPDELQDMRLALVLLKQSQPSLSSNSSRTCLRRTDSIGMSVTPPIENDTFAAARPG